MDPRGSDQIRNVRARVERLVKKADKELLLDTEEFLKQRLKEAPASKNPSGKKTAEPCTECHGARPPQINCEPWHLRKGPGGWVPRGAVCQPCEWAADSGKDRSKWKHWPTWRRLKAEAESKGEPLLIKMPPPKPKDAE